MTQIDDNLLKQFFAERKQDIADQGFSARVVHRLPNRANKLSSILMTCCAIASVILFLVFDGLQAILGMLRDFFVVAVQNGAVNFDLRTLLIAGGVLLIFGIRKIYTME
ncbi:DUF5056 domain-containing protein [Bacteroides sp. OttesenSCG-928-D19]|nr:DUF5056 domain-containing protein [Bacteroides sp. OttesenSCG-928-N06]MDL2305440.1 DUF5056 domain-containing protein [Bacteroides sp. OttesenSCG-928-D19]